MPFLKAAGQTDKRFSYYCLDMKKGAKFLIFAGIMGGKALTTAAFAAPLPSTDGALPKQQPGSANKYEPTIRSPTFTEAQINVLEARVEALERLVQRMSRGQIRR